MSVSDSATKCTWVMSVNSRRSTSGNRISATPVVTEWVRPESFSSIWRASSEVRGLPITIPSKATTVSAAITMAGPTARAATSSDLAAASRRTRSVAVSPGSGVSSTAEESTVKGIPASRRTSARRGEAEARINFIGSLRPGYYTQQPAPAVGEPVGRLIEQPILDTRQRPGAAYRKSHRALHNSQPRLGSLESNSRSCQLGVRALVKQTALWLRHAGCAEPRDAPPARAPSLDRFAGSESVALLPPETHSHPQQSAPWSLPRAGNQTPTS